MEGEVEEEISIIILRNLYHSMHGEDLSEGIYVMEKTSIMEFVSFGKGICILLFLGICIMSPFKLPLQ